MSDTRGSLLNDVKTKPLHVALIISEHVLAEYPMLLQNLLVGLATEPVQAALVCPPGADVGSIVSGPVEVIRHPIVDLPLAERLSRGALVRSLAEFGPTVLHCLCPSKAPLTAWLARRLDVPYILTINAIQKRWTPLAGLSSHCAAILAPARTIAANLAELQGRLAERIEQVNIGTFVADKICCYSPPSRIATMVLAHPFDNIDEFENLFNALRHLTLDGYEFMMLVMGGGPGESRLRELVAARDLQQIVTIVPPMRPCRSVMSAGDIFIQPQPTSAFNPFLLEAMSVGAAIAACRGGVDDLIVEGDTAVVFDPDDEMSIMAVLKQLLDKREFARKIAKAGQEYLRANHSVSGMIAATLKTYHNAENWYKSPHR